MQLSRVNRSVADRLHSAAIHLLRRLRREDDAMGLTAGARLGALGRWSSAAGRSRSAQLAQAEQVSAPTDHPPHRRHGARRPRAARGRRRRRPRRLAARHARRARGSCTPGAGAASPRSRPTWRRLRAGRARHARRTPPTSSSACCERPADVRIRHDRSRRAERPARRHGRTDEMMRHRVAALACAAGGAGADRDLGAARDRCSRASWSSLSIAPAGSRRTRSRAAPSIATCRAYRDGDRVWHALVGIDLDVKPGTYPVTVEAAPAGAPRTQLRSGRQAARLPHAAADRERGVRHAAGVRAGAHRARGGAARRASGTRPPPSACGPARSSGRCRSEANSAFGTRSIFNGKPRNAHGGADFLSPAGTPIQAPNAGRIAVARDLYFSGNTVVIDHGLGLFSMLAHLSAIDVHEGDRRDRRRRSSAASARPAASPVRICTGPSARAARAWTRSRCWPSWAKRRRRH